MNEKCLERVHVDEQEFDACGRSAVLKTRTGRFLCRSHAETLLDSLQVKIDAIQEALSRKTSAPL